MSWSGCSGGTGNCSIRSTVLVVPFKADLARSEPVLWSNTGDVTCRSRGKDTVRPAKAADTDLAALAGETGMALPVARLSACCEGLSARWALMIRCPP